MTEHLKQVKFEPGPFPFPTVIRWINSSFDCYAAIPFDADKLIERAKESTKLDEFGDEFWRDPLSHLVADINKSSHMHAVGAFLYKMKLIANLKNRLWARYWTIRNPDILDAPLPPVLLITGLQRTGTTFMQRLLGVLPEFRGLQSWELISPVANNKRGQGSYKTFARIAHFLFNYVNPYFKTIHSVNYNSLEEEVILMDHSFMSGAAEAVLNVPNYGLWLEDQDHTLAYEDLKMWLKLLLWRDPASQFLLQKSPHHMEHLDTYFKVFPDTKVIIIHRSIVESLASFCSMVYFGKMNFVKSADPNQIGKKWLRKNQRLVDCFLRVKRKHPDNFLEFSYHSLINDPIGLVREIYSHLGLDWTFEHEKTATGYTNQYHQNKFGKHVYDLADFGLTESEINAAFKQYIQEYRSVMFERV